jgi:cell division protein FtsI/penicillin-binding protein 2
VVNGTPKQVAIHGENSGGISHWDGETPASLPFGYGIFATPIQTAMAAAAIANDGVLMEPRIVRRVVRADNQVVKDYPPRVVRRVIQSSTAHQMVQAMRRVVTAGTGAKAAIADFDVAGKTGTTKKVDPKTHLYSAALFYASFVGFFPADQPEICILITADEPTTAGKSYYGGKACAPLFARMGREMASYLALQPVAGTNTAEVLPLLPPGGGPAARGVAGLHAVAVKP